MSDPSTQQPPEEVAGFGKYGEHYNEKDFWKKLKSLPRSASAQLLEKALILRELLLDGRAPMWIRAALIGVLGYLILPLDVIPDPLPGVGYIDDIAALILLLSYLDHLITDELRERVRKRMSEVVVKTAAEK